MRAGEDFVHVKLSPLGEKLAGEHEMVVSDHSVFRFKAGETQRVTRAFDWEKVLKNQHQDGEPLFMLADAPAPDVQAPADDKEGA